MSYIKCDAKDCVHNNNECCKKKLVLINGYKADNSKETNCNSFIKNVLSNTDVEFASPLFHKDEVDTHVYCSASRCSSNRDGECIKKEVSIMGKANNNSKSTVCSSFSV